MHLKPNIHARNLDESLGQLAEELSGNKQKREEKELCRVDGEVGIMSFGVLARIGA